MQNALLSDEHQRYFGAAGTVWSTNFTTDKDFYRKQAAYWLRRAYFKPIRFWLKNKGSIGARDVYIDLNFKATTGNFLLTTRTNLPMSHPSELGVTYSYAIPPPPTKQETVIPEGSDSWKTQLEVQALQPQREISPPSDLLIGANDSCQVLLSARIYADTLPQPLAQELKLSLKVTKYEITTDEFLQRFKLTGEEKE